MNRRALLVGIASTSVGLAGCSTSTDEPMTDSSPARSTTTATEADRETPRLDVRFDPVQYWASTFQPSRGRGVGPDDIVPEDDVPPVLRDALYDALDGGFETDSASEDLLAAIDEFRKYDNTALGPYVRLDGVAYAFDPAVPTLAAELADEAVDDYDPERVARDERNFDSEAVTTLLRAVRASGTQIPRSEYRTALVADPLESFLESYDYVEDQYGVSRIETERLHAEPPHEIAIRELTDEDFWGRPVVDEQTLDEGLKAFLRSAVESDHREPVTSSSTHTVYFADDVPEAYFDIARSHEGDGESPFFRLDETVYRVNVGEADYGTVPVDVSVEAQPPTEDGRHRFTLTVEATTGGPDTEVSAGERVQLASRGGVPTMLWVTSGDGRYLLESEEVEESAPTDPDVRDRTSEVVREPVSVGSESTATYAIPSDVPAGAYEARGFFRVRWRGSRTDRRDETAGFPFAVAITVPRP